MRSGDADGRDDGDGGGSVVACSDITSSSSGGGVVVAVCVESVIGLVDGGGWDGVRDSDRDGSVVMVV